MSRCTWALVDEELGQQIAATSEPNAKQWLFTHMQSLAHSLFVKLAVTLWAIWAARRKAIHEGIFQSPHAIHSFMVRFIQELEMIREEGGREVRANPAARTTTARRPKAPPHGHCKIHVDAGVRPGQRGVAVAVCRDSDGNYLGSSALSIHGLHDPATLEVIACREALTLASDLNVHQFVISSDSKQAIDDINGGAMG
uniref:RNase H type-1 domain-containing protein n=1 Tax=Triticum urartu TaxID=4572 RepID=A0A8R7Q9B0_TRIUA